LVRLLGDGLKGAVAMGLARELRLAPTASMFCLVAVVLGHVGLVQLGFHGGRGVAPCRGGLLVFDYGIVLVLGALAVLCLLLIRPFVLAGLAALVATPLWLFVVGFPLSSVFGLSALTLVILLAHRTHLREALGGGWLGASEERAKEAKRSVP
jgi:glycerol-3-phosphate acyltransferase PlsY